MIEKITDIGKLSGVSSPLLPLLYVDYKYPATDVDGVYAQHSDGIVHAYISLKNCCATVVKISDMADFDELSSFFDFMHVEQVLSDFSFDSGFKECALMKLYEKPVPVQRVMISSPLWKTAMFKGVYNLLAESQQSAFAGWFTDFSRRVNCGDGVVGCLCLNDEIVSCAVVPCIYSSVAIVAGVYTHEKFRGQGKAKLCLAGLCNELCDRGTTHIYLWCDMSKIGFYEKTGFCVVGSIYIKEEM